MWFQCYVRLYCSVIEFGARTVVCCEHCHVRGKKKSATELNFCLCKLNYCIFFYTWKYHFTWYFAQQSDYMTELFFQTVVLRWVFLLLFLFFVLESHDKEAYFLLWWTQSPSWHAVLFPSTMFTYPLQSAIHKERFFFLFNNLALVWFCFCFYFPYLSIVLGGTGIRMRCLYCVRR